MTDYRKMMILQRTELAESDDENLDKPLESIEGINKLIFEHLIAEGFNTPRAILKATPEQLTAVPGISETLADDIIEQIRKIKA